MNFCKLCDLPDWEEESFLAALDEIDLSGSRQFRARKHWEYAKSIQVLRELGRLRPEALAISVGAGCEHPIYCLANHLQRVHAIDIYGEGDFGASVASAEMLVFPERFAPFPYQQEALVTQYMDGMDLKYPDEVFDIAISLSSIEHFGGHSGATKAMQEMARVLRPGGIAVITTEVILNGVPHPEFFLPEELHSVLIQPSGLRLLGEIDFSFTPSLFDKPVDLTQEHQHINPHILCQIGTMLFTSVLLVLEKPDREIANGSS